MFCENVVTLVRWMCKSYNTFGLFNMYFFFSNHCALFSTKYIRRGNASTVLLWCSEPFFSQVLNSCYNATLVCSSGTIATTFFFFFSLLFVLFFFLLNIYKNPCIYCYTDTINFTIFSQLLRFQFLISQNKIIKYENVTNRN